MRTVRRHHAPPRVLALLLAAALGLAGCTTTEPTPSTGSPPPDDPTGSIPRVSSTAPETATEAEPPPSGGVNGTAPTPSDTDDPTPAIPGELAPTDLATGLTTPWGIDQFDDGRLLISERNTGRILRVDGAKTEELGDVDAINRAEDGLLGVAIGPGGEHIYAYYTARGENRVVRFAWDGHTLGSEELLLGGIPASHFHDGGQLRFGPDSHLYISTGDAGVPEDAQDPDSLAGKILRLTADGAPAPGNPFGTAVYSLGHRNVQGLAWDADGNLWASEFGANSWDELNLITAGGNYGWPLVEGEGADSGAVPGEGNGPDGTFLEPVHVWRTGEASPSGLAFWRGSLWMAGLRGERLWQIPLTGSGTAGEPIAHLVGEFGRLRAVYGVGGDGSLIVGTSNTDGRGRPHDGDDRLLVIR